MQWMLHNPAVVAVAFAYLFAFAATCYTDK